jgi:hypothetical protein
MFGSPRLLLAGLLVLLVLRPAGAVELFAFRQGSGRVLAFAVPNTEPIPATVGQAGATQAAVDWARRFYHLNDLDILSVEFQTRPARYWRVTFLVRERGQTIRLYAAVLPDGRPVEPIVREKT